MENQNNKQKAYNVCILGASLDTGNMGVSALAASLIKIILTIKPNAKISFLIGHRYSIPQELFVKGNKIHIKIVNYRLSPKAKLQKHIFWIFFISCIHRILPFKNFRDKIIKSNSWLSSLEEADFICDIRGGDSFSDIYGLKGYLFESIPRIVILLLKKKMVLLPQTYGPYNSLISRITARFILKRSNLIFSRDMKSIELIRQLIKKKTFLGKVKFCPDVAFSLDPEKPKTINISPSIKKKSNYKLLGFNINSLMYYGGYSRRNMFGLKFDYKNFVFKLIKLIIERTTDDILLIPHHFGPIGSINNDYEVCKEVMEYYCNKYKSRIHLVDLEYNQNELKYIITLCDFFIGSRMHACIAALSQGIPTISVAYSKKFMGVFDSVGLSHMVIDARYTDMESAIQKIFKFYENRSREVKNIVDRIEKAQDIIEKTFQQLLQ